MDAWWKKIFRLGLLGLFVWAGICHHRLYADDSQSRHTATLKSRYITPSDVHASSGDVAINESEFKYEYEFKAFGELPINFSLDVKHTGIDDEVVTELPTRLEHRGLGLGAKFPIPFVDAENYYMGFDIFPSFNTDDGDLNSSAFRIPFRTYLIYKPREEFILVAGISVRPEYDTTVLPVLGLIYKLNDRLSFNLASDDPNIDYKLTSKTSVFIEFGYANDEYEVTKGGQRGIVLKYQELSSGVGVRRQLNEHIKATVSVGGVFNRRLEYEEDTGKVVPEPAIYTEAKITGTF